MALSASNTRFVVTSRDGSFPVKDTQTGRVLRGLHDAISTTFYPNYSYASATNGSKHNLYDTPEAYKIPVDRNRRGVDAMRAGQKKGMLIDHQITKCVNAGTEPLPHQLHARAFYDTCRQKNLKPIRAQLAVGDPVCGIGTRVDVVCQVLNRNEVVVVELKTGFANYAFRHTGNLQPPLQDEPDSPFQQHQLQLTVTRYLLEKSFPSLRVTGAYVVYLHDSAVLWVAQSAVMHARVDHIIAALIPVAPTHVPAPLVSSSAAPPAPGKTKSKTRRKTKKAPKRMKSTVASKLSAISEKLTSLAKSIKKTSTKPKAKPKTAAAPAKPKKAAKAAPRSKKTK